MKSWIQSANAPDCEFSPRNLPYGVFSDDDHRPRCGVAIGDMVVDLARLEAAGVVKCTDRPVFDAPALNAFMALGRTEWARTRARLIDLLTDGGDAALSSNAALRREALRPMNSVRTHMPIEVAGYTDFYASKNHAVNVGTLFRGPENALPPNWLSIPIGYNGRASTVVVSGTPFRRPLGQMKPADADLPIFGPCRRLDFELEMGAIIGTSTEMGTHLSVAQAEELVFGYVLLNDWSARDIQAWEYQPLGPFQAKVFATTISPWIVTQAALDPFRVSTPPRERPLLPYLHENGPMLYDIDLEVALAPAGGGETIVSRTNYREMYYSSAQQIAHHAIGGCRMETGDLIGSGTISGSVAGSQGSLLELTKGGRSPIDLAGGVQRSFIEDGDTITLRGRAKGDGYLVGFGACMGTVLPAPESPR
ncbi:MAG: fumarylacetoacetase [Tagaea sp. CACIAM 22H2]|nr:fumarylacetoacetase [Tagaea sp. CACIAM 22H2]